MLPASFDVRWQSVSPLDDAAIAQLFEGLKRTRYGWHLSLPSEIGNFLGAQLAIDFQTRQVPERSPPPEVNQVERDLAKLVLLRLRDVVSVAEQNFVQYNVTNPDAMGLVSKPHIWIERGAIKEKGPYHWAMVVGVKGAPDFGWHLEFESTMFQEIWAGD